MVKDLTLLRPLNGIVSPSESESKQSPTDWLACKRMCVGSA